MYTLAFAIGKWWCKEECQCEAVSAQHSTMDIIATLVDGSLSSTAQIVFALEINIKYEWQVNLIKYLDFMCLIKDFDEIMDIKQSGK